MLDPTRRCFMSEVKTSRDIRSRDRKPRPEVKRLSAPTEGDPMCIHAAVADPRRLLRHRPACVQKADVVGVQTTEGHRILRVSTQ
eukprot:4188117-Pleurochrysis_carterae.AAC.1